jgi:hypothetical protein
MWHPGNTYQPQEGLLQEEDDTDERLKSSFRKGLAEMRRQFKQQEAASSGKKGSARGGGGESGRARSGRRQPGAGGGAGVEAGGEKATPIILLQAANGSTSGPGYYAAAAPAVQPHAQPARPGTAPSAAHYATYYQQPHQHPQQSQETLLDGGSVRPVIATQFSPERAQQQQQQQKSALPPLFSPMRPSTSGGAHHRTPSRKSQGGGDQQQPPPSVGKHGVMAAGFLSPYSVPQRNRSLEDNDGHLKGTGGFGPSTTAAASSSRRQHHQEQEGAARPSTGSGRSRGGGDTTERSTSRKPARPSTAAATGGGGAAGDRERDAQWSAASLAKARTVYGHHPLDAKKEIPMGIKARVLSPGWIPQSSKSPDKQQGASSPEDDILRAKLESAARAGIEDAGGGGSAALVRKVREELRASGHLTYGSSAPLQASDLPTMGPTRDSARDEEARRKAAMRKAFEKAIMQPESARREASNSPGKKGRAGQRPSTAGAGVVTSFARDEYSYHIPAATPLNLLASPMKTPGGGGNAGVPGSAEGGGGLFPPITSPSVRAGATAAAERKEAAMEES